MMLLPAAKGSAADSSVLAATSAEVVVDPAWSVVTGMDRVGSSTPPIAEYRLELGASRVHPESCERI